MEVTSVGTDNDKHPKIAVLLHILKRKVILVRTLFGQTYISRREVRPGKLGRVAATTRYLVKSILFFHVRSLARGNVAILNQLYQDWSPLFQLGRCL